MYKNMYSKVRFFLKIRCYKNGVPIEAIVVNQNNDYDSRQNGELKRLSENANK